MKFTDIKRGQVFNFPKRRKDYIFNGGNVIKSFFYTPMDDINDQKSTKTNREIEI